MRPAPFFCSILLLVVALAGCTDNGQDGEKPPDEPDEGNDPDERTQNGTVSWGSLDDALIRPGAPIQNGCVVNWLFTDVEGNAYIGTAAHCTQLLERVRERDTETMIGTVVFDSDDTEDADASLDFSLIQLDNESVALAHPAMHGWDGPTGVAEPDALMAGDRLAFYGHGDYLGEQEPTRARMGLLLESSETEYRADMPAVWGDSGSPVVHFDTGEALGIISRFGLDDGGLPTTDVGPLVVWILDELQNAGFKVELATA